MAKGIEFCIRMKEGWWLSVKDFMESGEKERIVSFKLPKKDRELLKDYPEMIDKGIKCRLVCIELENGEKEVLCTSLTDMEKYPYEDFCELYHFRWGIEESYKLFKARAEIEKFSGKTALAVKQEFFAKVFMMSLSAVLAFPIEKGISGSGHKTSAKNQPHQCPVDVDEHQCQAIFEKAYKTKLQQRLILLQAKQGNYPPWY